MVSCFRHRSKYQVGGTFANGYLGLKLSCGEGQASSTMLGQGMRLNLRCPPEGGRYQIYNVFRETPQFVCFTVSAEPNE
jgi:hypothetical protein